MANKRYIRCAKCGCPATPMVYADNLREVGTSTTMRCNDCAAFCDRNVTPRPYATMCRECCPTGHGTKWPQPKPVILERTCTQCGYLECICNEEGWQ